MICERSFCKHGRKRSVPIREQSGLGIFCSHRFFMRGQTVYIVNVVSFDFSFTPLFYWICSAPEQIQCSFRTLICVRRLRGPEGVVVVAYFFNASL